MGLFDSILHGSTSGFLKQQGQQILDKIVGNAAGMAWGSVSKVIPHASDPNSPLGKLLGGTMFGADPSVKLMGAGDHLSFAAAELIGAARRLAMSGSGGGGGFSRVSPAMLSQVADGWGGSGEGDGPEGNGLPTDGSPGDWGGEYTGGGMSTTKGIGIAAAAGAGAFGMYSGIRQGGARGGLTAAGSALGMVGAIVPLISKSLAVAGPIGMAAGMALGLVTTVLGEATGSSICTAC